ncbi:hypothetical protein [Rhizobium sp. CC-YZS058]|uniref:hypothetical protein n=1 Tax=Rhizobium sp. CC-YZS058 TaxID=3042153 RepID=UPI002B057550|nr:hypothetical protein [Rhizobium sp. CC-YZS058]MEA3534259.1 hypothetical protein [Rhizobium sp. CC-YZS058]
MISITPRMARALFSCCATPDRMFAEIAAEHDVDREELQEVWFDLMNLCRAQAHRPPQPQSQARAANG